MEDLIIQFVAKETLPLAVVLWVVGSFLKKTPKISDWSIPWILSFLGIALATVFFGVNGAAVIQGILATGLAVYSDQLLKQTKDKRI